MLTAGGVWETSYLTVGYVTYAQQRSGHEAEWLLSDQLGSTRQVANSQGEVIAEYSYDAYGNLLAGSSDPRATTVVLYTGLRYDVETRTFRALLRDYEAFTGVWLSSDPIGFQGGTTNLQEYVGNNPTNFTDPTGLAEVRVEYLDDWNGASGTAFESGDLRGSGGGRLFFQGLRPDAAGEMYRRYEEIQGLLRQRTELMRENDRLQSGPYVNFSPEAQHVRWRLGDVGGRLGAAHGSFLDDFGDVRVTGTGGILGDNRFEEGVGYDGLQRGLWAFRYEGSDALGEIGICEQPLTFVAGACVVKLAGGTVRQAASALADDLFQEATGLPRLRVPAGKAPRTNSAGQPINAKGQFLSGAGGDSAAAQAGRNAHKQFDDLIDSKVGWTKRPRLKDAEGNVHIPDALSPSGHPVELKPYTTSGIKEGRRQIGRYEDVTGRNGRVIYYDPQTGDLMGPFFNR